MKKAMRILFVLVVLQSVRAGAGDLTVEGDLNVTSSLTAQSLSVTNAVAGTLAVNGAACFNGTVQGDGSGLTNLTAASLAPGSVGTNQLSEGAVVSASLADGAVTSAKIQDGAVGDADVAADAAIAQSKVAGLTNAVGLQTVHLAAANNPHGVTAAQLGALTNETDAAALAALAQYAATNRSTRWRDSVDSNIWWECMGGTNLTVWWISETFSNDTSVLVIKSYDGARNLTSGDYFLPYERNTNNLSWSDGDWQMQIEFGAPSLIMNYGQAIWGVDVTSLPPFILYPIDEGGNAMGTIVGDWKRYEMGTVTNVIASYNLTTGDVWQAVLSSYPSSNPSNYVSASTVADIVAGSAADVTASLLATNAAVSAVLAQTSDDLAHVTSMIVPISVSGTSGLDESRILLFDNYSLTNDAPVPTWVHEGNAPTGLASSKALLPGTNHYHRTGWIARACRTGCAAYLSYGQIIPPKSPATVPPDPYIASNLAANLQNDLGAMIESPVFTNGIGTIYFEAINGHSIYTNQLTIYIATNMYDVSNPTTIIPTVLPSSTNNLEYDWKSLDVLNIKATTSNDFTRYIRLMNCRQPIKLRIRRTGNIVTGASQDSVFTVVDNIRVSSPPTVLSAYHSPDYTGLGYAYQDEGIGGNLTNDRLALLSDVPSVAGLASQEALDAHAADAGVHVTLALQAAWNAKPASNDVAQMIVSTPPASNSVTAAAIASGSIGSNQLADASVVEAKLADGAVTSAKIQNGAVGDADVAADAAIAQSKVAGLTNAVGLQTVHLAAANNPHGVTAAQVGAYTEGQTDVAIAQALAGADTGSCVRTNHTGDVAVEGTLSARVFQGDGSGLTNLIATCLTPGSVGSGTLAAGAVVAAAIADGAVGTAQLAASGVVEAKLADGAVTSAKLAAGSVGTNKADVAEWNAWGDARYVSQGAPVSGTLLTDGSAPMTGNLQMGGNRVTGLADAADNADAVNFQTMTNAIQQALLHVGPLGNLSMGAFTAQ